MTGRRFEESFCAGLYTTADLRHAVDDKADGNRELRHAFDKLLGAVDGIDDPDSR